nr:Cytidine and deoxycytidylate deaminase zinc-binding region [uncultured bacterium]
MIKRDLMLHIPVIHKGYINLFSSQKKNINKIYLLSESFLKKLSDFKPDIASLEPEMVKSVLEKFGFENVSIVSEKKIESLSKNKILLINDEISRNLHKKFLPKTDIQWQSVFLRWDRSSVLATNSVSHKVSKNNFDKKMMELAYKEAGNSSDWWRQVGAILVKDKKEVLATYNESLPNDHTPYQVGAVRDFLNVGEKPELSSTIHGEQRVIAEAAKHGISLLGTSLYVTHFPCAVCAKLIACSGIKNCFYGEGSSNLDGEAVLKAAGVNITKISI